jgi:SAM-dependent methyltransferase
VCGNAETLPFPDGTFHRVVALGTLEHCRDPAAALREVRRVLRPGGVFLARSANRFSVLPEPHVGVWGVGWLPRRWADPYVRWRSGRSYRHHRLLGPGEWRRLLRRAGLVAVEVRAGVPLAAEVARLPAALRRAVPAYTAARDVLGLRTVLRTVAPLLDVRARAA